MKKIIKLTESDLEKIVLKVLKEQSMINELVSDAEDLGGSQENVNTEINSFNQNAPIDQKQNMRSIQRKLKSLGYDLGTFGPNKDGVDGNYGRRTLIAIKNYQSKNGINPTGWVGTVTAPLLGVNPMKGTKYVGGGLKKSVSNNTTTNPVKKLTTTNPVKKLTTTNKKPLVTKVSGDRCIALSEKECSKIDSTKQTVISSGAETRCSAYMVKCLSQYDSKLFAGNAWDAFNNVRKGGSVKYNAYTDGSVNWSYIYSQLKQNKIGKNICSLYSKKDNADKIVKSPLPKILSNSIPSSSKINLASLKLGDVVGLYHSGSDNKGMAFCQRSEDRNLDELGNMDKEPFTFNSHVGFVGAIKNNVPIIIHNVHGTHTATPATKMLTKDSDDMIVWVVSDNDVATALNNSPEPKKSSWFDKFSDFS